MKYSKINLQKIALDLKYQDWQKIKTEINHQSGYVNVLNKNEQISLLAYKQYDKRNFSYDNLQFADYLLDKHTQEKLVEFQIQYNVNKINIISLNDQYSISHYNAVFECPSCNKQYIVDCNPSRNYYYSTLICKKCQKSILHKCQSYIENYESSMIEKYGVARPYQSQEILNKAKQSTFESFGVYYAMQSDVVKLKHANNMLQKWGRKNYFEGLNPVEEFSSSFKERGFLSRFEKSMSQICVDIFGEYVFCCLTKKFKLKNIDTNKWYSPDFYDEKRDILIEFNGDYFHANPEKFDDTKKFRGNISFAQLRLNEIDRFAFFKQHIKYVYVVWETNWKNDFNHVLDMLKEIRDAADNNSFIQKEKLLGWQP